MIKTLSNQCRCGKSATRKNIQPPVGIILGPHRIRTSGWADVCTMARNGYAVIRDGADIRLCWSEAFETGVLQ